MSDAERIADLESQVNRLEQEREDAIAQFKKAAERFVESTSDLHDRRATVPERSPVPHPDILRIGAAWLDWADDVMPAVGLLSDFDPWREERGPEFRTLQADLRAWADDLDRVSEE